MISLLRFLRVPAAPTAPADVIAGFAIVAAPQRPISEALLAAGASLFLYLAGMGLNDLRDRDHDAIHRPSRPIPSGRLSILLARATVATCFVAGFSFAAGAGRSVFCGSLVLAALIAAYDFGGKRLPVLGPLLIAGCRAMNLALGMIAGSGVSIVFPLLHGVYTASLTLGSAYEEGASVPGRLIGSGVVCALAAIVASLFVPSPWPAVLVVVLLGAVLVSSSVRAVRTASVIDARRWVKFGVLGFLLYDAALLAGNGRGSTACVLVALFPVCLVAGRAIPPS
ncbi:MAG: UbiA family prenyltransferase [Planctomycetes bacterium]|nr:UbiA family prenyltransferase [Planctomycetota bacterium]MBI3844662.1 UbiA family prenyltransferase [Planctomycetota bacterium]